MNVKDIMTTNVITVDKNASIKKIAHMLVEKDISGVPVIENKKIIGIITHKDILYKDIEPKLPAMFEMLGGIVAIKGVKHYNKELKKILATRAEEIMNKKLYTIESDKTVEIAADIMVEKDVSKLPVLENGELVGIISRADIVKYISKLLEEE